MSEGRDAPSDGQAGPPVGAEPVGRPPVNSAERPPPPAPPVLKEPGFFMGSEDRSSSTDFLSHGERPPPPPPPVEKPAGIEEKGR